MNSFLNRIIKRYLYFRRIGKLSIGREVIIENKGEIKSGYSYLGGIKNLTVNLINSNNSNSYLLNEGKIILGNNVRVHKGFGIHVGKNAELSIGDNSYINPESIIICHSSITIGSGCAISWRVELIDDDLHSIYSEEGKILNPSKPISIGNNVWIGAGAKILKGVTISDNAIVAAGSVVTCNIESNSLYGGCPSKKIKSNLSWK